MPKRRDLRAVIAAQAKKARNRFLHGLQGEAAGRVQQRLYAECVTANQETAFGREHGFARLAGFEDFRKAVPLRSYDELAPWIEWSAGGEQAVLTCQEPVRFWKTTGTTSTPKTIPVTPLASTRTMESFLTLQGTQLHYYPGLNERADTTLVTHVSPKTIKDYLGPRRVPYCSTTEVPVEVRPGREEFTAPWMRGLQAVEEDDAVRLYYQLCYAAGHDVLAVACLHPSRFRTVVSTLEERGRELIGELAKGTVLGKPVRAPDPQRAARLGERLESQGRLIPRDLWPNLQMVTSWSGTYIERYRPLMEECFSSNFLAMPSISSEAFTTMTVDEDPVAGPLNIRGGLFEFLPAGLPRVESDTPTFTFDQLQEGERYELVLTSLGGLYRYQTCDIFCVRGWVGSVPRLEYVGRRSVSDLTGEKLAEEQVADTVPSVLTDYGLSRSPFTVCAIQPAKTTDKPRYVLVVEAEADWTRADELGQELDQRLKALNSRYELKRNFQDLESLSVVPVAPGTFARYRHQRAGPAGQLKDSILHGEGRPVLDRLRELHDAP